MAKRDYYDVLGVAKNSTPEQIKAGYRKQAIKYHPDKNKGDKTSEEKFKEAEQAVDLTQADVIVSVGRGICKKENIEMARELSKTLGGEIAASRPVVDAGWLESSRQVGSSGQTVSPKLYLALGISGAIQHVVGMKGSKNIVVINKDANAPLFEIADYGVVGDIFEIVPKLISGIQGSQ